MAYDFPASPVSGQIFQPVAGGPIWQYNGYAWSSVVQAAGFAALKRTVITNSTSAFQYDPQTKYADVEVVGGGGGGAGTSGSSSAGTARAGGGGGAGGYVKKVIQITDAVRAATKTINVGAGGTAAPSAGGNSSYTDGISTLTANGGGAGTVGGVGSGVNFCPGGSGGASSGGDYSSNGSSGDNGIAAGSSANTANNASGSGGNGAAGPWGGAGAGAQVSQTTSGNAVNGGGGAGWGSGGGGGVMYNASGGNAAGGAGFQGVVIITEYFFSQSQPPVALTQALDRNRIINPAFQISQETGDSGGGNGVYAADMWLFAFIASGATLGCNRVSTPSVPNGSNRRCRINISVGKPSLAAADYCGWFHAIEGEQIADLQWGTANAKPIVVRFWFRAPAAGTYALAIRNGPSGRSYVHPFTVNSADGQLVTAAIPGDTSGTWPTDNTRGMTFSVALAVGTTYQAPTADTWLAGDYFGHASMSNGIATNGPTSDLMDVGLYVDPGSTGVAPPWQLPDQQAELEKCQRYWETSYPAGVSPGAVNGNGALVVQRTNSATTDYAGAQFKANKRIAPTMTVYSPATGASGNIRNLSTAADVAVSGVTQSTQGFYFNFTAAVGHPYYYHYAANARM